MASYHAIAATSEAIRGLLAAACPRPEFAGARFELYQASSFQEPMDEGMSLYLYRVIANATRRNLPPRVTPDGRRFRGPLPLDLHYLLTPWAKTVEKQQRLLGWAMRTLEDTPVLPPGLLNQFGPDPHTFRPEDAVELVLDPLSLQDMANISEAFKPNLQLSVAYVARMVAIDSALELPDAEPVQTREYQFVRMGAR